MLHGAHASGPSAPTSAAARRANRSRCAAAASPSPLPLPGCGLVESSRGSRPDVEAWVASALGAGAPSPSVVAATALGLAGSTRRQGKVRDVYDCGDCVVAVTTDRLSAFDRVLCCVPLKVWCTCVCAP